MSDNKLQLNATQTEQTSNSQNTAKNLKRRIAYKEMPAEKKTALLERRRADYCTRRHVLSQKLLPPHSSLATSAGEQLIECDSAYEIG